MEKEFTIEIYERSNHRQPFKEFYDSLNSKDKSLVLKYLDILEDYGNVIGHRYSKKLDNHIFELRVIESKQNIRILYFFQPGRRIIITNAFAKKTQKTPHNELILANIFRINWIRKQEDNQ